MSRFHALPSLASGIWHLSLVSGIWHLSLVSGIWYLSLASGIWGHIMIARDEAKGSCTLGNLGH
jgi:hypothetical protein